VAHRCPEEAAAGLAGALARIREALGAETAYVVYGDDQFRKLGDSAALGESEVKPKGYWLLNRFMVERAGVCAFNVVDREAHDIVEAEPGVRRSHASVLVPMPEGKSEMLLVGGLAEPLRQSHIAFLELAAPIVAHLVARRVDAQRLERQKQHLNALGDIARVMTQAQDREQVLEEIATAVSGITGFDVVVISVPDPGGKSLARRVINRARYSDHLVARYYRQGALDEDIIAATREGRTLVYPDVASDSRLSEPTRLFLSAKGLFSSMARFPLIFHGETLGLMSVLSFSTHSLDPAEVKLLEGMAAQVAMTMKGLDMYEELRSSREKLQEYTDRLQESVSIEYRLARTDPLTGIPNRRYLNEAIASEAARALKEESGLALVVADVDGLKRINDMFGHLFGDDILRLVGSLGWQMCRRGEMVGRYGGDEFLFILPRKSTEQALKFGEGFRASVEKSMLHGPPGQPVGVTISAGISPCNGCLSRPAELVEMADKALYQAKAQGRNRVVLYRAESVPQTAGWSRS
jgi:diguanylate cyclase (GGDEF)-like protein